VAAVGAAALLLGHPGVVATVALAVVVLAESPILAAQRLRDRIDPTTLSGTVILVRLAHVASSAFHS
jgi:hypothetical protein